MESRHLLDSPKQDGPAISQRIQTQFWFRFIGFLRGILCGLSEYVTYLELWAMGAEESHKQAESRNPETIFIRIDNQDGNEYYCEVLLDTGASINLISTRRVADLRLSYEQTTEEKVTIFDLDGTPVPLLGSLEINYQGGRHGHSPQRVEAATFYVMEDVPYGIILGQPALNDLHVFTLDPLYFSRPPGRTPKERILTVSKGEKQGRRVCFAGKPVGKTFFPPNPGAGLQTRPVRR